MIIINIVNVNVHLYIFFFISWGKKRAIAFFLTPVPY